MFQEIEKKLDGLLGDFARVYGIIDSFDGGTQAEVFDYFKKIAELYSHFAFENNIDLTREQQDQLQNSRIIEIIGKAPETDELSSTDFSRLIKYFNENGIRKWLGDTGDCVDTMSVLRSGVKVGAPTKVFLQRNGKDSRHIFIESHRRNGIKILEHERELLRPDYHLVICDNQIGTKRSLMTTIDYLVSQGYKLYKLFIYLPEMLMRADEFRRTDFDIY